MRTYNVYALSMNNICSILYSISQGVSHMTPTEYMGPYTYALKLGQNFVDYVNLIYNDDGEGADTFKNIYWLNYNSEDESIHIDSNVETCLDILGGRFGEWYCDALKEDELNDVGYTKSAVRFINKIISIITNVYPKYEALLNNYEALKNNLIDPIYSKEVESGSGASRFNDTPQTTGDHIDNSYTTNINLSENEITREHYNETKNNIELLEELNQKFDNTMLRFVNEIGYRMCWKGDDYE